MNHREGEGNGAVGKVLLSLPIVWTAPPPKANTTKDGRGSRHSHSLESLAPSASGKTLGTSTESGLNSQMLHLLSI